VLSWQVSKSEQPAYSFSDHALKEIFNGTKRTQGAKNSQKLSNFGNFWFGIILYIFFSGAQWHNGQPSPSVVYTPSSAMS